MVCLQADPQTLFTISKERSASFYDEDLPDIWLTAVAFWPTEDGSRFADLKLA
jgi:hypothetical protein